jgi:hypothetical protein
MQFFQNGNLFIDSVQFCNYFRFAMSEQEQVFLTIRKLVKTVRKNASPLGAITAARVEMLLEECADEVLGIRPANNKTEVDHVA